MSLESRSTLDRNSSVSYLPSGMPHFAAHLCQTIPGNPPTQSLHILRTSLRGQFMYLTASMRLTILAVECSPSAYHSLMLLQRKKKPLLLIQHAHAPMKGTNDFVFHFLPVAGLRIDLARGGKVLLHAAVDFLIARHAVARKHLVVGEKLLFLQRRAATRDRCMFLCTFA